MKVSGVVILLVLSDRRVPSAPKVSVMESMPSFYCVGNGVRLWSAE